METVRIIIANEVDSGREKLHKLFGGGARVWMQEKDIENLTPKFLVWSPERSLHFSEHCVSTERHMSWARIKNFVGSEIPSLF